MGFNPEPRKLSAHEEMFLNNLETRVLRNPLPSQLVDHTCSGVVGLRARSGWITVRKIAAKDKTTDTVMASKRIGVVWLLIVSATTPLCLWTDRPANDVCSKRCINNKHGSRTKSFPTAPTW